MLFYTAKLPQNAFIIDLYCRLCKLQRILYKAEYLQITNSLNEKNLY